MADPRVSILANSRSVNDVLLDASIRHAVLIEGVKNRAALDAAKHLNGTLYPRLIEQTAGTLARIRSNDPLGSRLLTQLTRRNGDLIRNEIASLNGHTVGRLRELAVAEADWAKQSMRNALTIDFQLRGPDARKLKSLATHTPIQGRTIRKWFDDIGNDTAKRVAQRINIGLANGETNDTIVRALRGTRATQFRNGVFATTTRQAQSITRTAFIDVAAQSREAFYKENADLIKGVRLVATLDNRTTDICISVDGQVFAIDKGPRPALHHQCRTATVPVTRSWSELGIPLKDTTPTQRASMNGLVPKTETYAKWFAKQSESFQKSVLTPGRYRLFKRGFPIERFVSKDLRPLSMDELLKLEGLITTGKEPRVPKFPGRLPHLSPPVSRSQRREIGRWKSGRCKP